MAGLLILAICPLQNASYKFIIVLALLFITWIRTDLSEGHHHCWHIILQHSHMMQLNILWKTIQGLFVQVRLGEIMIQAWNRTQVHKNESINMMIMYLNILLIVFLCVFHCTRMHSAAAVCTCLIALCASTFSCFSHRLPCTNLKCLRLALRYNLSFRNVVLCLFHFNDSQILHSNIFKRQQAHFTHLYLWGKPLSSPLSPFSLLCLIFWRMYTEKWHRKQ